MTEKRRLSKRETIRIFARFYNTLLLINENIGLFKSSVRHGCYLPLIFTVPEYRHLAQHSEFIRALRKLHLKEFSEAEMPISPRRNSIPAEGGLPVSRAMRFL